MTANIGATKHQLWVSTSGRDTNDGSKGAPFKTIQKAIQSADPDTTIFVKAGLYTESLRLTGGENLRLRDTTPDMPLKIVSVDGRGAATISAPSAANPANNKSAITIFDLANIEIRGFKLVANAEKAKDDGGIKIAGDGYTNKSGNILIADNIFTGKAVDGIKAAKTKNLQIENNTFDGYVKEQAIDLVSVKNSLIRNNDFRGDLDSGITMKGGSYNIEVARNHFDFRSPDGSGPAVKIGGEGWSNDASTRPLEFLGFEAKNINVHHNVVDRSGEYSVLIQGGRDSIVADNYLGNDATFAIRTAFSRSTDPVTQSSGNTIRDNILESPLKLHTLQNGATNVGTKMIDNKFGSLSSITFDYGVGATAEAVRPPAVEESAVAPTTLTVVAGGTGTSTAAPKFEVLVDGVSLGVRTVTKPVASKKFNVNDDSLFDSFVFKLAGAAPKRVDIVYFNDGSSGGINRDLVVDHIKLGGLTIESETFGDFRAASGNAAFDGPTERMFVNGTLAFADLDTLL